MRIVYPAIINTDTDARAKETKLAVDLTNIDYILWLICFDGDELKVE